MTAPARMEQIRPRQPQDLPALVLVLRQVHETDGYPSVWPDDPLGFVTASGVVGTWVADLGSGPLGQVTLCDPAQGALQTLVPEALEVKRLFVGPEGRGLGLAARLMNQAQAWARSLGRPAALQVDPRNAAALNLYRQLGWQPVATVPAPWRGPDGRAPLAALLRAP
ncbi:GNAT family N-acetyltransferase [Deinococcus hohokamensis]|uniref:GNAT family N-acetyltransferase n=1 Tax=Deinococcus hohokamensis TaxID=309883 RepID=A0ABV9I688_9DEIO